MKKSFKVATMCSGIGSPEQSLKELEVEHENVFACEKDKFARQTYLANFTTGVMLEDMTTESWDLPSQYADLVVAGIPCQSFSLAGKRQGENDPRGLLIYDFIRYVKKRQPKVFIIENVKGLLSDNNGITIGKWKELLGCSCNGQEFMFQHPESCGYNLHMRVLNAKHYGLPQNRERVFIIGIRPDLPGDYRWPKRVVLKDRLIDLLESEVDEKYYLSLEQLEQLEQLDRRRKEKGNGFSFNYIEGINENASTITKSYCKLGGGDLIKIAQLPGYETNGRVYSEQVLAPNIRAKCGSLVQVSNEKRTNNAKLNRKITGTNDFRDKEIVFSESDIANCLQTGKTNDQYIRIKEATKQGFSTAENGDSINIKHPNSSTRRGRVGKQIANTIETTESCVVDNYRIRRYTPLECMRLMGYPDTFIKSCSETQTYKQAGNSIPVHMMKAILKQLLPILTV